MNRKVSIASKSKTERDAYPAIARERAPFIHLTHFFRYWYRCSKDRKDKGEQGKQYPGGSVHHREAEGFVKGEKEVSAGE
jgi:hypothetical protein